MGGYTDEFKPFLSTEIHKIFLHLLWELDQEARSGCREYTDTTRGEMFKFCFHMLSSNPEFQKELLSNFFTVEGLTLRSTLIVTSRRKSKKLIDGGGEVIVEGNNKRHGNKVGAPMHENKKLKVNMIQPQVINLYQVLDGVELIALIIVPSCWIYMFPLAKLITISITNTQHITIGSSSSYCRIIPISEINSSGIIIGDGRKKHSLMLLLLTSLRIFSRY